MNLDHSVRRVIIGVPRWQHAGPYIFAERLVRGLHAAGWEASILLTEVNTTWVHGEPQIPAPDDLPCDILPCGTDDTWGERWEALERYLEERAPCHYVMLHDWRNNVVAPRLSNRVFLTGLVQADYSLEIEQCGRLGQFWNAIVAVSEPIQLAVSLRFQEHIPRILTIRNVVSCPETLPKKATQGPLKIAYSGELRKHQKRLRDIISIARLLRDRGVDFEISFLGDGPIRSDLEDDSRDLQEARLVKFLGRLDSGKLMSELASNHVIILTSDFEGLSIALLEGMSRGCVPVVTELPSQSFLIRNGENSLTAPIGGIEIFAAHLESLASDPVLRSRLSAAAFRSVTVEGYREQDMVRQYTELFDNIERSADEGRYRRNRQQISAPPLSIDGIDILPCNTAGDIDYLKYRPMWPEVNLGKGEAHGVALSHQAKRQVPLSDHKIIFSIPAGQISGVDVFTIHMVRSLRKMGLDARILGQRKLKNHPLGLGIPEDVPVDEHPGSLNIPRDQQFASMHAYFESSGPCIFIPNYDYEFSHLIPRLPSHVRAVCIIHSDDPAHYNQAIQIGWNCDAVVAVSHAIADHLRMVMPGISSRVKVIPYGIEVTNESRAASNPEAGGPLKIFYSGRMVRGQKRARDLVLVALELDRRGIPFEMTLVGDGPERSLMEELGQNLIFRRILWMPGKMPNHMALELMRQNDIFLLTSAFEGLPVSLLEAMAHGLVPVVSAIRSGVPELIQEGRNGFTAPVGDIKAFADRIEYLHHHPVERFNISSAACSTIVEGGYLLENMVDRYLELFHKVVKAPPVPRTGKMTSVSYLCNDFC